MNNMSSEELFSSDELVFVPLGGSGEIGMNANLYHYKDRWLMIDLGISFADDDMPGVDVILPDIDFIAERRDRLDAIILTHAHEDHFGAIPYLWDRLKVPVYGTAFTIALLKRKLAEQRYEHKIPLHVLDYNIDFKLGPFSLELVQLNHSIPDPAAIVLSTEKGRVLHTGDWKFDATPHLGHDTDKDRLKVIGDAGVLAMVGDSTNAMVEGRTASEDSVRVGLTEVIKKAENRVVITCFASNVARIDSILKAAQANDRSVCIVGRALNRTIAAAQDAGYLDDMPDLVSETDFELIPRENIVLICTGSQGEPRAAMSRIAAGQHDTVKLSSGDCVVYSSRQIPGNEAAINRVQDMLINQGVELITDEDGPVHVSGHPARDEMIEMYSLVRPQIAIPVHGTARHLKAHAELAQSCQVKQTFIPDNGSIISLGSSGAAQISSVDVTPQTQASGVVISAQDDMLKSRRRMLWNGSLSASLVLDASGELMQAPSVCQTGICPELQADGFCADASLAIEDEVNNLSDADIDNDGAVRNAVMRSLRGLTRSRYRLRPIIDVHIMRI